MVDRIEVPGSEDLAVSADGAQLFVAAPKGDFSGRPTATTGIRSSALGRQCTGQLSVFSTGSHELCGTVEVIDLMQLRLVATLHVDRRGEAGAHGLAYLPSSG